MENKNRTLIGIAGAHFVAAELSKIGYIATLTSRNTQGIDVLASTQDGLKTVSIQVKTLSTKGRSWPISKKYENVSSNHFYYVFVTLKHDNTIPDFYIVPSEVVAKYIKESHLKWLNSRPPTTRKRIERKMRHFVIKDKDVPNFLKRWDILFK